MLFVPKWQNPFSFPCGRSFGFDPSHVAAKGISSGHGFSAIALGANFVSLLTAKAGALTGAPVATMISYLGNSCSFSGTQVITFANQSLTNDGNITIAAIIFPQLIGGGNNTYFETQSSGLGGWRLYNNTINQVTLTARAVADLISTLTVSNNFPYFVAASASASLGNFLTLRLDTGKILTATTGGCSSNAPNGSYLVGNFSGGGQTAAGCIAAVMFSPSFMSMSALLQWATDPWSFWYPRLGSFRSSRWDWEWPGVAAAQTARLRTIMGMGQ